jgi:hypothetical protein
MLGQLERLTDTQPGVRADGIGLPTSVDLRQTLSNFMFANFHPCDAPGRDD